MMVKPLEADVLKSDLESRARFAGKPLLGTQSRIGLLHP